MKTRKLLFTMIAAMTMVFGLTLTAHAEETPAPATKVVGVEGIGTFTVPADWTEEYIEGYGTYWFNPTKTACASISYSDCSNTGLADIEVFAPIYKKNLEEYGCAFIDWRVTKYFNHDAIYSVDIYPGNNNFSTDYSVLNLGGLECGYDYYLGNSGVSVYVGATTAEEFQNVLPMLATYKPVQ